ncbi:MAG: hypothetical protein OEW19_20175, partial [Acidobacteriota bacterium]|nr:hypothetical protein [Acidobacteriota bacterium]
MRNLRPLRNTLRLVAILALIAATVAVAQAQTTVTAIWDANTDPYTAGYRVYYGTASGSYLWSLDAGNQTSVPIPLAAGGTYYFTVRAYNSAYEYGPASSEASVSLATLATITGPTPGSTLAGSSVSFTWTTGFGALQYWLYVGTTGVGSANLWNQDLATATSRTVTGIPTTGAAVYVRLWTRTSTGWQFTDYTYT